MCKADGLLLLLLASRMFADVVVVGPASNPSVGDTFSINVNVTNISDLYAYQLDLTYDPTLLSAVSVSEGPFLASGGTTFFIPGTIDNVGGSVTATADALIGAISGVNGSGTLLTFQFTAIGAGTSALNIANPTFLDSSFNDITGNIGFDNSSVTINPASSVAPEPGYFALCAVLLTLTAAGKVRLARGSSHNGLGPCSESGRAL
jgi:general secretion pathway protein D